MLIHIINTIIGKNIASASFTSLMVDAPSFYKIHSQLHRQAWFMRLYTVHIVIIAYTRRYMYHMYCDTPTHTDTRCAHVSVYNIIDSGYGGITFTYCNKALFNFACYLLNAKHNIPII